MKTYNDELYRQFNEIADLMSILSENGFKIRAYREAARRIKENVEPITKKNASEDDFKKWPGVGDAIAAKMMQYIETGHMNYLDELRAKVPPTVRELMNIPGLGPIRVRDLYINLGIRTREDLIQAAESGKIAELPRFGKKLVTAILEGIQKGQEKKRRHERAAAEPMGKKILALLKKFPDIQSAEIAGSFRRKAPTVGDLDILATGKLDREALAGTIRKEFLNATILGMGETKLSFVIFPENLQVDIRIVPKKSYGAALLYFTGSKNFNVMMRKKAIAKGYLLNEYGLLKDGEYFKGATEGEVFDELGMGYVPPEKRK